MSHHQESAKHKSNHAFISEHHDAYPHVNTPHGVFQEHQTVNITDLPCESSIPPTTALSSRAFSNGSTFIDFEIPKSLHVLKDVKLCMDIVNNDIERPLMLPVAFNLIDRFEIYFGSTIVETVLSEALYLSHCIYNSLDKRDLLKAPTNTNSYTFIGDLSNQMVDPNGSEIRSLIISLHSLLSNSNIFLPGLVQELRIRVHFRPYSKWGVQAYSAYNPPTVEPVLQKVELRVGTVCLADHNYKKLEQLYRNTQVNIKYLDHRYQSYSISSQSGVTVNHVLSSINGLLSHMYIFARIQNGIGNQILEFKRLNKLWMTDSSGSNIFNGIQYTGEYLRGPYAADHFETSSFFQVMNVYPIAFSNDVMSTVKTGNCLGARHFSAMEQLYITPGETANLEIMIFTFAHSQLHIKNGIVSVSRS